MILRAHHLLCILGFRGHGYSDAFTDNMSRIVERLHALPQTAIEIAEQPDDICAPCPFLKDDGCRQKGERSEEDVRLRDRAVMDRLGLATGDRLSWNEIAERIKSKIRPEDLDTICGDCQWLPLGYCAEGLRALKD